MKQIIQTISIVILLSILLGCGNEEINYIGSDIESSDKSASSLLRSKISGDTILINWNTNSEAIAYIVEWGEEPKQLNHSEYFTINKTRFIHTHLKDATIYYYRLKTEFNNREDIISKIIAVKSGTKKILLSSDKGL